MALSRVTPSGWLDESGQTSRVTPFGWVQEAQSTASASATINATTGAALFSGSAHVSPVASLAATTADATFSGAASAGTASASVSATTANSTFSGSSYVSPVVSFSATAANATISGSASGYGSQGTITTPALKNNTGTVLANETGVTVYVYTPSTGGLVVKKTGQTTNVSGVLTVTDASIAAGTQYRIVIVLGSGAEGMDKLTAS